MKGDILACYGNDIISRAISLITKSKVVHIAIAISDKYLMESGWFGVKLSKISSKKGQFYVLRDDNLLDEERHALVDFVMDSVDIQYDYKLFFGMGLNRIFGLHTNWNNKSKYICIELAIAAYKGIGIQLIDKKEIFPGDLLDCNRFTILSP